jgi:hypothetical protein
MALQRSRVELGLSRGEASGVAFDPRELSAALVHPGFPVRAEERILQGTCATECVFDPSSRPICSASLLPTVHRHVCRPHRARLNPGRAPITHHRSPRLGTRLWRYVPGVSNAATIVLIANSIPMCKTLKLPAFNVLCHSVLVRLQKQQGSYRLAPSVGYILCSANTPVPSIPKREKKRVRETPLSLCTQKMT